MEFKKVFCTYYCKNRDTDRKDICVKCGDFMRNLEISEVAKETVGCGLLKPASEIYEKYMEDAKKSYVANLRYQEQEEKEIDK